jgi:hypothetical protein
MKRVGSSEPNGRGLVVWVRAWSTLSRHCDGIQWACATKPPPALAIQAAYADWLAALPEGLRGSLDLTNLGEIELPRGQAAIGNANEKNGTVSFVRQITSGFFEPTRVPLLDPDCTDVT